MNRKVKFYLLLFGGIFLFSSCSTLEKASSHGFSSGYYTLASASRHARKVYVSVTEESLAVYPLIDHRTEKQPLLSIPFQPSDSFMVSPLVFRKKSLDVDITSILLKYRPSLYGLPGQLTTDFNVALYAGWRHDRYTIKSSLDPLGNRSYKIRNWGHDIGLFAGPGASGITPFSTRNKITDDYSGLIVQMGIAGFIESNVASFGLAIGYDYLLNPDRKVWIYQHQPWLGFIVGVALN